MPDSGLPSHLAADRLGPWGVFLDQVARVEPHLGALARWVETLRRPRRILLVDVPIELDNGEIAHFEAVQDAASFFWSEDEINAKLERILGEAFESVWAVAAERRLPLRSAAFITACARVLEARALRGLYP